MNKLITKEEQSKIKQLIEGLESNPKSFIFLEPVDHVGLGLTDYLDIVKHPMDLSTIKKKLKAEHYNSLQEFFNDVNLIWSNCKLYNQEGSEIYLIAVAMEKHCKKLVDKLFKEKEKEKEKKKVTPLPILPKSEIQASSIVTPEILDNHNDHIEEDTVKHEVEDDKTALLPYKDRMYICERVRKLTNDGLASLVRLVEKELPHAIDDSDPEKIEIKLTLIDRKFYDQINQLIDTYLKVRETNQENLKKINNNK